MGLNYNQFMNDLKIINKVGLAVFKDNKILCVRSRGEEVFYSLGGKIEEGETEIEALKREVREELGCEMRSEVEYLETFEDWAHGKENTKVQIKLFRGKLMGEPKALSEIEEMDYLDTKTDAAKLSAVAINQMFPWLKKQGYIN
jgi:8-oxo-dGTP diphosphatase